MLDDNNAPADNQEPPAALTLPETSSDVNLSEDQGTPAGQLSGVESAQVDGDDRPLMVKRRSSSSTQSSAKRSRRSPSQPVPQAQDDDESLWINVLLVVNSMVEDRPSTNLSLESPTQQPLPASRKLKELISKKMFKFQIPDSEPQLDSSKGNKIEASSVAAAGSPPSSSILEAQPPDAKTLIKALASQLVSLADQVVNADSIQAKDAELAAQKEEIKSLKGFCQKEIEDWENIKKDLKATKATLRAISAEKETAEKSLKVVQAELEANRSGLAQALSDRDSAQQLAQKMKEDITEQMNAAGIISASVVFAVFKDHYPDLDMSVINNGFKGDKVEAQELVESFEDLAQSLVEKLSFSYSASDDEESSPST